MIVDTGHWNTFWIDNGLPYVTKGERNNTHWSIDSIKADRFVEMVVTQTGSRSLLGSHEMFNNKVQTALYIRGTMDGWHNTVHILMLK